MNPAHAKFLGMTSYLIKVENDLIQETNALHAIVYILRVEICKIGNGSEKDGDALI